MNFSWYVSLEFVKALLVLIGGITVVAALAMWAIGWWLTRNADGLNRHSS